MAKIEENPAVLALADGTIFHGFGFGSLKGDSEPAVGEVVFNTSMYGYQEILTDPSYAGQLITFTYPHIGNVGCNSQDNESREIFSQGTIVRDLSQVVSNYRAEESLDQYLKKANKMGIAGFDTRQLVSYLRDKGSQMGAMASGKKIDTEALIKAAKASGSMEGKDYVQHVTCDAAYTWQEIPWSHISGGYKKLSQEQVLNRPHVIAIDCGIKFNILRILVESGFRVTVVPATWKAEQILALNPDALFLSNGPGDPAPLNYVVETVKSLLGRFPIFGICLGLQILAQAAGAKTYKLKFGHRGGNHPVKNLKTGKVEITVQNHGFAVDADSVPNDVEITHINLNDNTVEGLDLHKHNAFCVQYHPEASPGPHDSKYLFNRFFELVVGYRESENIKK